MEKREGKGGAFGGVLAVILAGIIDAALACVLLLVLLAPRAAAGKIEADLPVDFVENAEGYGQVDTVTTKYSYGSGVNYVGETPSTVPQSEPETETDDGQDEGEGGQDGGAGGTYDGFVFPDSNATELSAGRIASGAYDAVTCRRAINELYARHGYAFSKQENIDFFSAYDWYRNMEKESDMDVVYRRFNAIERKNLEKLQAHEKDNGWN